MVEAIDFVIEPCDLWHLLISIKRLIQPLSGTEVGKQRPAGGRLTTARREQQTTIHGLIQIHDKIPLRRC